MCGEAQQTIRGQDMTCTRVGPCKQPVSAHRIQVLERLREKKRKWDEALAGPPRQIARRDTEVPDAPHKKSVPFRPVSAWLSSLNGN